MTTFLRLLADTDKAAALQTVCARLRQGETDPRHFEVAPKSFDAVPGKPFAYWVSEAVRETFKKLPPFESDGRTVRVGLQTSDDFRFLRNWWEACKNKNRWFPFAKGGNYSPFYSDVNLVINWKNQGDELNAFPLCVIRNPNYYLQLGITWPLRAHRFSPQAMSAGSIFSVRGYSAFPLIGDELVTLAIFNSSVFDFLFKMALGRFGYPEFIVGILQIIPWAQPTNDQAKYLATLARRSWSLKRTLDTVTETSHAFLLPAALRPRLSDYDPSAIEAELAQIQSEIDAIAFNLYGFAEADRQAVNGIEAQDDVANAEDDDDEQGELTDPRPLTTDHLLSWAVGVAFGRFDRRLATGERAAPPEPDPFDPLPAKSPGMLPDGAEPFHPHHGILIDDQGHPHDLAHLIEEVLGRVNVAIPDDVRRWLQRDFFPFHLQRYSKSRRKAPIYWPLATPSGSYTLWLYYPSLTSQTLYTAINDFVEPKLKQVRDNVAALRDKGAARSRNEEKQFEALQTFELELIDLHDALLKIAPNYKPHHDDGVQITAAPLWPLFRHKPWQKVLKDTWAKLEKGDYDWAHLSMNDWPDRVREKCKTDKSLAIAHGLEDLYIEPEAKPKPARGRKNTGASQ